MVWTLDAYILAEFVHLADVSSGRVYFRVITYVAVNLCTFGPLFRHLVVRPVVDITVDVLVVLDARVRVGDVVVSDLVNGCPSPFIFLLLEFFVVISDAFHVLFCRLFLLAAPFDYLV